MAKRPDKRHVQRHAQRAIAQRLGYPDPRAVPTVERDGRDLIVRCNSGGNVLAVEAYLNSAGYRASFIDGACAVRVMGR